MRDRLLRTTLLICGLLAVPIILLVGPALAQFAGGKLAGHAFYIPSESMEPTLMIGDRLNPRAVASPEFRRGMVVVFTLGSETRVARIVGLPGDTVQMQNGRLILNGKPVEQRPDGEGPRSREGQRTERFAEQLPGEPAAHHILDAGFYPQDNTDLFTVPVASLFLLGDNRDNAADSRFPRASADNGFPTAAGAGFVPFGTVVGRVDFVTWSTGRWRIGRAIDDSGPDKVFTWL